MAGAALFLVTAAVVASWRAEGGTPRWRGGPRGPGKHDVLQDRAVTVRNWRRGHRWWLLLAFVAALASSFALPAAGGLLLAGRGAGLWLKAARIGRRERAGRRPDWVRVDWLGRGGPAGKRVKGYRTTGLAAGDAAPGGARRRRR